MKTSFNFILLILLVLGACKPEDDDNDAVFDRNGFLQNYANNIIAPRFEKLDNDINAVQASFNTFKTTTTSENLDIVQADFLKAYLSWQACTQFDFGPSGMNVMKATFNSYPTDTSLIVQNIASGSYNLGTTSNLTATGFPALDFLLFEKDEDYFQNNAAALTYLEDIILQMKDITNRVSSEWNASYKSAFIETNGTDLGSSLGALVNDMNLDYEKFIRDGKVGIPLGVRSLGTPQLDKIEAYYSEYAIELLRESLLQFRDLYNGVSLTGTNGLGFDDYLEAIDAKHQNEDLNTKISEQFAAILGKLNQINDELEDAIETNPAAVQALYDEMQKLIVYIKVDLSSSIGVLISYQDNDGD